MNNKKGSAMIWSTVAGMIMMVLSLVMCTMALSYHTQTMNIISDNQIYLTSRSCAEVIAREIETQTDLGKTIISRIEMNIGKIMPVGGMWYDENHKNAIGDTTVTLNMKSEEEIIITSTTQLNKRSGGLIIIMNKRADKWEVAQYEKIK